MFSFFENFQIIDMVLSLYQSSIPMRFGVILYSTKLVKAINKIDGHLLTSLHNDKRAEDVSSFVSPTFMYIVQYLLEFAHKKSIHQLLINLITNIMMMNDYCTIRSKDVFHTHFCAQFAPYICELSFFQMMIHWAWVLWLVFSPWWIFCA